MNIFIFSFFNLSIFLLRDLSPNALRDQISSQFNKLTKDNWKFKNYGAGAQILVDLGLSEIILLTNNPKKPVGLDSYGLKIIKNKPLK